jgi:hypothetical protein
MRYKSALLLLIVLVLAFAVLASAGCQSQVHPSRYLLPEGYVGWVRIDFKVVDAQPVPVEGGYPLYKIPQSGILQTSSEFEYGMGPPDEYYYYSGDSRRQVKEKLKDGVWTGEIIQRSFTSGGVEKPVMYFFVGTKEEFSKYARYEGREHPLVGPVLKASP